MSKHTSVYKLPVNTKGRVPTPRYASDGTPYEALTSERKSLKELHRQAGLLLANLQIYLDEDGNLCGRADCEAILEFYLEFKIYKAQLVKLLNQS